jgi:hypothetical protein
MLPNVEVIRVNDGAARASHETCLRKAPDPVIGSTKSFCESVLYCPVARPPVNLNVMDKGTGFGPH